MAANYYETDRAAAEYLLFHYGAADEFPATDLIDPGALNFPTRIVSDCLDSRRLSACARALDLGCAVGRSSFELARSCAEVIGIEKSRHFVAIAEQLRKRGSLSFMFAEEGDLARTGKAVVPREIDRKRVRFQCGDATKLPATLGRFDVVLMANLIDRLRNPRECLAQLPALVKSGGQLIITSPYTWLPEYTPRRNWLGGFARGGKRVKTFDRLKTILLPNFRLIRRREFPFLIREHARKFQFGIAEATVWLRRSPKSGCG